MWTGLHMFSRYRRAAQVGHEAMSSYLGETLPGRAPTRHVADAVAEGQHDDVHARVPAHKLTELAYALQPYTLNPTQARACASRW